MRQRCLFSSRPGVVGWSQARTGLSACSCFALRLGRCLESLSHLRFLEEALGPRRTGEGDVGDGLCCHQGMYENLGVWSWGISHVPVYSEAWLYGWPEIEGPRLVEDEKCVL